MSTTLTARQNRAREGKAALLQRAKDARVALDASQPIKRPSLPYWPRYRVLQERHGSLLCEWKGYPYSFFTLSGAAAQSARAARVKRGKPVIDL